MIFKELSVLLFTYNGLGFFRMTIREATINFVINIWLNVKCWTLNSSTVTGLQCTISKLMQLSKFRVHHSRLTSSHSQRSNFKYGRHPEEYVVLKIQVEFPHSLLRCGWLWVGDNLFLRFFYFCHNMIWRTQTKSSKNLCRFKTWIGFVWQILIKLATSSIRVFLQLRLWCLLW